MKPTQQEIIDVAREVGFVVHRGEQTFLGMIERLVHLALERFGAGGGEPVAFRIPEPDIPGKHHYYDVCEVREIPTNVQLLYTHPSPTALRAEYMRGLEDAAKAFEAEADTWKAWPQAGAAKRKGGKAIRALKGKQ